VEVINTQIEGIQEFLESKVEEDSNFRSAETGFSFADLNSSFEILKTVDTTKLESLVNTNNLTKDRDKLIKDYEYKVKRMELEMAKKSSEAEEARRLMDQFKKEDYVLIPDATRSELKTENPSSYYNTLAEIAITASVEAASIHHEIKYYKNEIERLKAVTEVNNSKLIEEADNLIESIRIKMVDLINTTNGTLSNYYSYKYGKSIRQIAPAEMVTGMNVFLNIAISLVIGVMLGVFTVFLKQYWKSTDSKIK